jgi:hypothetical protein
MQVDTGVTAVAHVIQLAVAPVFLLSGIGAMLSVMTSRLARVVDRARVLEREVLQRGTDPEPLVTDELSALSRRARLISRSISLCTVTALLICAVIAVLFVGAFLQLDTSTTVALLFITAMVAFFAGLLMFLREILLATATVRIGLQHLPSANDAPPSRSGSQKTKDTHF